MPLVQSTSNAFELVDRTNELLLLPKTWTLLGDSGLFRDEPLSTQTVTFEERSGNLTLVGDQIRGAKPQTRTGDVRKMHSYGTTHHPIADALYPQDIAGVTRPGANGVALDTESAAILRKLEGIRKSFDVTMEVARFKTLGTGQVWAPNGTVVADFYTDFGLTRNQVDFVLGTGTTDIVAKCEEIIAGFQASATEGQIINRVLGYASPVFFRKLIAHAKVQTAYTYFSATEGQMILRNRAGGSGLYRTFSFAGIDFIEVPTVLAGEALVVSGDCVFVAQDDTGSFTTYRSPANRFGFVNTIAENSYVWTYRNERNTEITFEAEMNFLNVLRKPNFVARGYSSN